MTCWKCGKELPEGSRFCGACGAEQKSADGETGEAPRAPEPPRPQWNQSEQAPWNAPGAAPKGDLRILFKIFGWACAVVYGVKALGNLFSLLRLLFNTAFNDLVYYMGAGVLLGGLVRGLTGFVFNALVCAVSLLIALRRRSENADGLFLGFAGSLLARFLVNFLVALLCTPIYGGYYFSSAVGGVMLSLVLSAAVIGVLFGISALVGEIPVVGKTPEELKASFSAVLSSARSAAAEAGAKASAAAQNIKDSAAQSGQDNQYQQNGQDGTTPAYAGYGRLKTDRSLLMYIILNLLTCGIYHWYFIYKLAQDVNTTCQGDGDKTNGLGVYILLNLVTCGIYAIIWEYSLGNRLAANAPRYGMHFQENGTTVLLWVLFGALVCGIGPYVAMYIIIKNTNSICLAYNRYNNL